MSLPEARFGDQEPGANYIHRPCAYGLAVCDSSALLIQGATGGWFLPGGGIEEGESREVGLIREILEELGCSAEVDEPFARATQLVYSRTESSHFRLDATYHRALLQDYSSSTGEHPSEWVQFEEAQARLTRAADRWSVAAYLRRYRK